MVLTLSKSSDITVSIRHVNFIKAMSFKLQSAIEEEDSAQSTRFTNKTIPTTNSYWASETNDGNSAARMQISRESKAN